MSLHINREIGKTNKRRVKPKAVNTKKAIPLFLYPVEAVIYQKSDTINLKKNILSGAPERAKYEMETLLEKNNVFDYEISVVMPQGHPVNMIAEDAGRSIHGTFDPFIKADEKRAERQKRLDIAAASKSAKIDRATDGWDALTDSEKLIRAHNKGMYLN